MPCKITYNNNITGVRHPSLIGYLFTQHGLNTTDTVNFALGAQEDNFLSGDVIRWGDKKQLTSDYQEYDIKVNPRLEDLNIPQKTKDYMIAVQDFYNRLNLNPYEYVSNSKLLEVLGQFNEEYPFSLIVTESTEKDSIGLYTIKPAPKSKMLNSFNEADYNKALLESSLNTPGLDTKKLLGNAAAFINPIRYTPADVIGKVLNHPEVSDETKKILKQMLPVLGLIPDLKMGFSQHYKFNSEINPNTGKVDVSPFFTFGNYNPLSNSIYLSPEAIKGMEPEHFARSFAHELVHAVTVGMLETQEFQEEKKLKKTLDSLKDFYTNKYQSEIAANPEFFYGLKNSAEFIAEFITNKAFRDFIINDEDFGQLTENWFKRFLNWILSSVNLRVPSQNKVNTLYQDLLNLYETSGRVNRSAIERSNAGMSPSYLIFKPQDLTAMDQALQQNSEFLSQVNDFLDSNSISWNKLYQEAGKLGVSEGKIKRTEELYRNINRVDAEEAFKSLTTYLHETALYLLSAKKNLDSIIADPNTSLQQKFTRSFHARELAKYYKDILEEIQDTFNYGEGIPFGVNTILGRQINNINSYVLSFTEDYYPQAINAIADKLAEEVAPQTKALTAKVQKEVDRLEEELKVVGPRIKPMIEKKLKEEKETLKKLATKENLKRAFKKEIEDINFTSQYLESARLSNNIIVGTVGTFISNLYDEANREAIGMEVKAKALATRWENHQKSKGKQANTSLNYEEYFKNLYKKVTIKEIRGLELVDVPTIVLNSEMDEIAYLNDKTTLRHEIITLENEPPQSRDQARLDELKQQLKDMEDTYEVSRFTDEWYRIQNLLSPEAKAARNEIIEDMIRIQSSASDVSVTEEELDQLDELKFKLDRLESDYDENGNLKDDEALKIARSIREWKKEKNANDLYTFEVSEERQLMFDHHYQVNEQNYALAVNKYNEAVASGNEEAIQQETAKLSSQKKQYLTWKRANTVRQISPEFYKQRRAIIDRIALVQSKYVTELPEGMRPATEVFDEMFNLLKGYKDSDNIYEGEKVPEDIALRIKTLQDELEAIREVMSELAEVSGSDKDVLSKAYNDLNNIQTTVTTSYYQRVYNQKLAEVRTNLIAKISKQDEAVPEESELQKLAEKELKKTDWFKNNHRLVSKWNGQRIVQSYEPIFIWVVKEPKDESMITSTNPSFKWKSMVVNPKFLNNERTEMKSVNRVALRKDVTKYKNDSWGNLDQTEKDILNELTNLYLSHQKTVPRNLRKGLELPGVQKSSLEMANPKLSSLKADFKSVAVNMWDSMTFKYSEDTNKPEDSEGPVTSRHSRRLFLKYSNRIGQERMSVNVFNSITQFSADMIRFKKGYEQMPYIFGIQDILEKNKKGTKIAKAIDALIESRLQGQSKVTWSDNKILSAFEGGLNSALNFGAYTGIALRLPSTIKNQLAGTTNLMFQLKGYGLDQSDFHKAGLKNMKEYANLFRSYVEDGIDTEYIQKIRYFNIMPEDHLSETGKNLFVSKLGKASKTFSPIKHLEFLRTFGEFEMRSAAAEALSNKLYRIELADGKFVPILHAYDFIDGVLRPRQDIKDLEGFAAIEAQYRNQLNAINSLIHGQYSTMDKAEYSRYTLGRLLMFMKGGWLYQQGLRRFGGKRISYSGGFEYEGFYRTMLRVARQLVTARKDFKYVYENVLTQREKADFLTGVFELFTLLALYGLLAGLNALRYSDGDEEEDKWALYQLLFTLTLLEDELSTLNPIAGGFSIWYSRFYNNVDGTDAPTYYASKEFWLPLKSSVDMISTAASLTIGNISDFFFNTDLGFNPFNEYVPLSRNGKVLNPKNYPPDPTLSGMSEFSARALRMVGLDASINSLLNPEYVFRKYEKRNPRWYIDGLEEDLKSTKTQTNSIKKQIKALERQKDYVEDAETKEDLQSSIDRLENKLKEVKKERQDLNNEYFGGLK